MSKKHTTSLGVQVDMAALRAKNEKVRAVGNMNVNARGDVIDSNNNVINDANMRIKTMYDRTFQQYKASGAKPRPRAEPVNREMSKKELADLDDNVPNPKK